MTADQRDAGERAEQWRDGEHIDALVGALRQRVEERRKNGEYPSGLEGELDDHFRRIVRFRPTQLSFRDHLDDIRDAMDFDIDRIPTRSRIPGGRAMHRVVGRAVARQTRGVLTQVEAYAVAVQEALESVADPLESVTRAGDVGVTQQLDALHAILAEQQETLNRLQATVAALERRIDELAAGSW
ncbi:MAG: hypothetical protein ACRDWD_02285 [Acidimicrobiia bacterium]